MIDLKDIYYAAGLLEGEGCFSLHSKGTQPFFAIKMSDEDTIEKIKLILRAQCYTQKPKDRSNIFSTKKLYKIEICGGLAIQWMMTIYPLMSERRKKRIKELIEIWKSKGSRKRPREVTV